MPEQAVREIEQARQSLTQLATQDALLHLESALRSLEGLAHQLHGGLQPTLPEKRQLERELMKARSELRRAACLAEQGLAFCKDWTALLEDPVVYRPDGQCAGVAQDRGGLTLDA
jgi:hypothetical protein